MRARRGGAAAAASHVPALTDPYMLPPPRSPLSQETAVPFHDMRVQAEAGDDPMACLMYGWALSRGEHGLPTQLGEARTYFQRAADLAAAGDKAAIAGEALHSLARCSPGAVRHGFVPSVLVPC